MEKVLNFKKIGSIGVIHLIGSLKDQMGIGRFSDELVDLCAEISWDEEIRVMILTNTQGKSFLTETSLVLPFPWPNGEMRTSPLSLSEAISKIDKPVIAVINGDAIGQGLELLLACDIRIATKTSYFGLPHIRSGLIPWDGGTQRLSRLVGRGKALEMILTGEVIGAQEALRIGLVHKVVSRKDLMEVAVKMAQEMASKGPIALRYAKEAIYKGMDMTLEQGLRLEADLYLSIHTTKDRTEGIQAFREKRAPKFEGK